MGVLMSCRLAAHVHRNTSREGKTNTLMRSLTKRYAIYQFRALKTDSLRGNKRCDLRKVHLTKPLNSVKFPYLPFSSAFQLKI